jgi:hypothetical protein
MRISDQAFDNLGRTKSSKPPSFTAQIQTIGYPNQA